MWESHALKIICMCSRVIDMQTTKYNRADSTSKLLRLISYRMSNKREYRKSEYQVTISPVNRTVSMIPVAYVFPDMKHRLKGDEISVNRWAYNQLTDQEKATLIPGHYKYTILKKYPNGRLFRKWRKSEL